MEGGRKERGQAPLGAVMLDSFQSPGTSVPAWLVLMGPGEALGCPCTRSPDWDPRQAPGSGPSTGAACPGSQLFAYLASHTAPCPLHCGCLVVRTSRKTPALAIPPAEWLFPTGWGKGRCHSSVGHCPHRGTRALSSPEELGSTRQEAGVWVEGGPWAFECPRRHQGHVGPHPDTDRGRPGVSTAESGDHWACGYCWWLCLAQASSLSWLVQRQDPPHLVRFQQVPLPCTSSHLHPSSLTPCPVWAPVRAWAVIIPLRLPGTLLIPLKTAGAQTPADPLASRARMLGWRGGCRGLMPSPPV